MLCFRRTCSRKNALATYLVLLVFFKLALQGSLLWTLLFLQAAVRRYDTTRLLFCFFPSFFRGDVFGVAPR